jgi:hypothetical protein
VLNDPINLFDPTGLSEENPLHVEWCPEVDMSTPVGFCQFLRRVGISNDRATQETVVSGQQAAAEYLSKVKGLVAELEDCYKVADTALSEGHKKLGAGPAFRTDTSSWGVLRRNIVGGVFTGLALAEMSATPQTKAGALAAGSVGGLVSGIISLIQDSGDKIEAWEASTGKSFVDWIDRYVAISNNSWAFKEKCLNSYTAGSKVLARQYGR